MIPVKIIVMATPRKGPGGSLYPIRFRNPASRTIASSQPIPEPKPNAIVCTKLY